MVWCPNWKRQGRGKGRQVLKERLRYAARVARTSLGELSGYIKERVAPRAVSVLSWLRSAWQATRGEMERAWQNLKPLRLPAGWQIRVLLAVVIVSILIPGVNFYLHRPVPPPAAKPMTAGFRADDINLLARLVAAEAQDEPYPGQVAVVAVVLNRLRDPAFPKSVPGIIFEPWAFESVANGRYWQVAVLARDYAATNDALNGWDPSQGALYFFNPAKATSAWIWTRPQITQIGNHIFTR
ncbi:spore cortex-lytic enzyme precursor [Moorella thermoacetica]|nr:spore cortex-lytic enzyme precursor [Moorella thermoacetica]